MKIIRNQPQFNFEPNPAIISGNNNENSVLKKAVPFTENEMRQAQTDIEVYKDLVKCSDGIWYIKNPDGTPGESAVKWKQNIDSVYDDQNSDVRRDFR